MSSSTSESKEKSMMDCIPFPNGLSIDKTNFYKKNSRYNKIGKFKVVYFSCRNKHTDKCEYMAKEEMFEDRTDIL
ncbi:hypothetical protein AYI69_g10313 [Smittium culicis]|uniref:Uncharacterized protein n=1 Tax=Smittium culicis TaxID=133412 RepID=A0A1R1X6P4_9FUNG|nr:hypothetical protein AYI69_g10313 [Smittium culicis]